MLFERFNQKGRLSHTQLGMAPSIWLFERSRSIRVSRYFNDAGNFLRLQDARYRYWILREWEKIVSPSFFYEWYHIVTQVKIFEICQPPDRAKFYCACQFIWDKIENPKIRKLKKMIWVSGLSIDYGLYQSSTMVRIKEQECLPVSQLADSQP